MLRIAADRPKTLGGPMVSKELVNLDASLLLVAFGIECAHGVGLRHAELYRAIDEVGEDGHFDCRAKDYTFHSGRVRVTGEVDDYEPQDMWLVVDGHPRLERDLRRIIKAAEVCYDAVGRRLLPPN